MPINPGINSQIMLQVINNLGEAYNNKKQELIDAYPFLGKINTFLNGSDNYVTGTPMVAGGPVFKKMQSFEELKGLKDALSRSTNNSIGRTKTGKISFGVTKQVDSPKRYVKSGSSKTRKPYQEPTAIEVKERDARGILEEDPTAYMNALNASSTAAEMNLPNLSKAFYEDARFLNPQKDAFKSRFLWGGLYKKGGTLFAKSGIHIKKSNRGKFTDYCGGKVTNECIQRGKRSSNPAIRKRATFAANSRTWSKKHMFGGILNIPKKSDYV